MVEKNPLSNLSYTNKDFQEIYPELLNYVKNSEGYTTPNLNAFGYGINQDTSAWKEL